MKRIGLSSCAALAVLCTLLAGRAHGQAVAPALPRPSTSPTPAEKKTDRPAPATIEKKVTLPAAAPPAPDPAPGAAIPIRIPFVLSEMYYYEPATGTKYEAKKQGSTWVLPIVDTLKAWNVTFLFTSNVAKEEIARIVQKKACCYQLLLSNQSVNVGALTFAGDRVFLRALVPDMQDWPKTVQLKMFHSGGVGVAPPSDVSRAPSSGGGMAPRSDASRAPSFRGGMAPSSGGVSQSEIQQPFIDYKSTPVSVQAAKMSYFAGVLYPTFSHPRCTDCHSMGDKTAVETQHAGVGEAAGVGPVNGTYTHQAGCGGSSCHTLVKDWRTPPFAMGINWKGKSAKEICNIVIGHLPTAGGLHQHFHDDPRVIWAVSSGWVPRGGPLQTAPPHNAQAWFQMVDYWINGGFPCPE